MIGIVCERLSEDRHCNVNASIKFHDCIVRPKNLPYFLAGNNVALALHQDSQNLEGLLAELDFADLASTAAVPIETSSPVRTLSSNVPSRTRSAGLFDVFTVLWLTSLARSGQYHCLTHSSANR